MEDIESKLYDYFGYSSLYVVKCGDRRYKFFVFLNPELGVLDPINVGEEIIQYFDPKHPVTENEKKLGIYVEADSTTISEWTAQLSKNLFNAPNLIPYKILE